jgi:hypothetical protein
MTFDDLKNHDGHSYKVKKVEGVMSKYEVLEHHVQITGTSSQPSINCLSGGHSWMFQNLRYDSFDQVLRGEINDPSSDVPIHFHVSPLISQQKVKCKLGDSMGEPGSWTAEDDGPLYDPQD